MNTKSFIPSFYVKNYYTFIMFGCFIIILLQLTIPDEIINNSEYHRNFSTTEPLMLYLLMPFLAYSFFNSVKSVLQNKFKIRNSNIQESCRLFLLNTAVVSKILFYFTCFGLLYYQGTFLPKGLFYGFMDLFYFVYLCSAIFFAMYALVDFKLSYQKNIKLDHWIDSYLEPYQLKTRKTVEQHDKVVSVFFKDFLLDERDNSVIIKKKKLKLDAFKQYLQSNNCKLVDLTPKDLYIIEMLGI